MPSSLDDIVRLIEPGMRVLLHAGQAECLALRERLIADPERAAGVTFVGLFIPGINGFDYAGLTPTTRVESLFVPAVARESFAAGRHILVPVHYSSFPAYLARNPADLAILHLPPARQGVFSCGIGADLADGVLRLARKVAVIVNPEIPQTAGAVALREEEAALVVVHEAPLGLHPSAAGGDAGTEVIARRVADLIEDGDTVQAGIGRLPAVVLRAITDRRQLRVHAGMLIDEVALLLEAGALAEARPGEPPPLFAGITLGSAPVLALAARPEAAFYGVGLTHDVARIAARPRFAAINSAIEVDLFGNINCERVRGRQISGIGGAGDFTCGARMSQGGRAIFALPSEARSKAGSISRIVPVLGPGETSIARADMDILVTEHGTARLRDLSLDARAEAIMALAAPEHRPGLAEAWAQIRAGQ